MGFIEKLADELFFLFIVLVGIILTVDMVGGIYEFYSPNPQREETRFERIERLHDELMERVNKPKGE